MKYIDEFRNHKLINAVSKEIKAINPKETVKIMEVCGTHTVNFFRFGLKDLLPSNIRLISGPGCPVCVSDQDYIDRAIAYAKMKDFIVATFGDMLRVPGSNSSLEKERAQGADIRILYSAHDALRVAEDNLQKKIIFLSVGFETTIPTIALSLLEAKKKKIKNLLFFSSLKLIPPAMKHLLDDKKFNIQGFLCPGHVSSVIGTEAYEFIARNYRIPCCVAGFEPLDIMQAIHILIKQMINNKPQPTNQYLRLVKRKGNRRAQLLIKRVFKTTDTRWRGIGIIPKSGLEFKDEYASFDAGRVIPLAVRREKKNSSQRLCRCGQVLKGIIRPDQCPLFSKECTPNHPFGPCMVSLEGACNAYYKYN